MKDRKLFKYSIVSLLLSSPLFASAAGIQVSPGKLDFTIVTGKETSQTITVVNPTADVQVFEVYSDDFSDAIKALPESFTLESGAKRTVNVTVNASALKSPGNQNLATNLSVVAKPLADNKFSVATGVKLPLAIKINQAASLPNKNQWPLWTAGLVGLVVLLGLFNYKAAKRAW